MPAVYMKYYKAVDRVYNDLQSQEEGKYKEVEVHVLYGDAGAGKTRYVYDKHGPENVYRLCQGNGGNIWFDGYTQQKVLLIDDYYGWLKYSKFLQIIDNYKIRLSVKGGTTYSGWDTIYITSNNAPKKWYAKMGLTPAMARRFKTINKMTIDKKKVRKPEYNIIHTNNEGETTTIKFKNSEEQEGSGIVLPTTYAHQDEKQEEKIKEESIYMETDEELDECKQRDHEPPFHTTYDQFVEMCQVADRSKIQEAIDAQYELDKPEIERLRNIRDKWK
jgi:hypothetical protein